MIIALEGIEGCGKTTQAFLLAKEFELNVMKFPNYERMPLLRAYMHDGKELEKRASFLLFLADILEGSKEFKGNMLLDRYFYSTLAYTTYDFEKSKRIVELLEPKKADLVFLLDVEVEEGMKRKHAQKNPDRYEQDKAFLEKVRKRYIEMAKEQFLGNWIIVDASKPTMEIFEEIRKVIKRYNSK